MKGIFPLHEIQGRLFLVTENTQTLTIIPDISTSNSIQNACGLDFAIKDGICCTPRKLKILEVAKGTHKYSTLFFYGLVANLCFDRARYGWRDSSPFMYYTAKATRDYLHDAEIPVDLHETKWKDLGVPFTGRTHGTRKGRKRKPPLSGAFTTRPSQ